MRLKSIRLKNFQSHKDTFIELSKSFNCVTGSWHSGKSSLVRALAFLFYNDWHSSYNRFGNEPIEITATLEDGSVITRIKGENINKVIVNGLVFENFGNTLPEEVSNLLGIVPLQVDVDQQVFLNVSQQDDGLFLLSERGPYRAKTLNKVFGVSLVDTALRNLSRDKKQCMGEIQEKKERIKQLSKELEPFSMLLKNKERLLNAEGIVKEIEEIASRLGTLKDISNKLKSNKSKLTALQKEEKTFKDQLEEKYKFLASINSCPFCGKELEEGQIKELLERFK